MRTFDNLRMRKQLVIEAMASILARKANEAKSKWVSFFCCRIKSPKNNKKKEAVANSKEEISSSDEEEE